MADDLDRISNKLRGQLRELEESYEETLAAPEIDASKKGDSVIVFSVQESLFALPLRELLEIVPAKRMVNVPGAAVSVCGALSHQQEVITVIDLAKHLSISSKHFAATNSDTVGEWVLVLRPRSRQCGLLVDSLEHLFTLKHRESSPIADGVKQQIVADELVIRENPVAILDATQLFETF